MIHRTFRFSLLFLLMLVAALSLVAQVKDTGARLKEIDEYATRAIADRNVFARIA